jgi:hypothetical protein
MNILNRNYRLYNMGCCLIQQLFRLKIGHELDTNVVDGAIFHLLLDAPRGIREKSNKLMVDIRLMRPNAISIKGSILGVANSRLWEWYNWEPGQAGQDYPEWTIHPLRVTDSDDLDSPARSTSGPFPDEPWPDPEYLRCWPPREIIYAAEHAEQARASILPDPADDPKWGTDPILWGLVRIVNYLRTLKHAKTPDQLGYRDFDWIGLEETTDIDCEMDAWDRMKKLCPARPTPTDLLELAAVKADVIREDNSCVNEFLEDSVLNLKKIYLNRVDDWTNETTTILVLSR